MNFEQNNNVNFALNSSFMNSFETLSFVICMQNVNKNVVLVINFVLLSRISSEGFISLLQDVNISTGK